MFYLIWIPLLILLYVGVSWLSVKSNNSVSSTWFILLVLIQLIPGWAIVSRFSKNITIDSMLYDIILFLTCSICISLFSGQLFKFNTIQIAGFVIIIIGFIMIQIKY